MYESADRSVIHLQLIHNHLPRLADADLIDYDRDTDAVQLLSLHPRVTDIIQLSIKAEQHDDSE